MAAAVARVENDDRLFGSGASPLWALAAANVRFWPTVLPVVRRELLGWERSAARIGDPGLRAVALEKLRHERFNAEVAATLATLSPRGQRAPVVESVVALEVLFDYLDGRTERLTDDPVANALRLYEPLIASTLVSTPDADRLATDKVGGEPDGAYLIELSRRARRALGSLPAARAVAVCAEGAARRCAHAQSRIHAVRSLGAGQLELWAAGHSANCGLGWREYAAGCASSVLALHALIASAAAPWFDGPAALRLDRAYLAIGAVITLLDSVVDRASDRDRGEWGMLELYEPGELDERLPAVAVQALARAREAPRAEHHVMTLAGVVAYYTSHPGARGRDAAEVVRRVRRVLAPTIWPALAVMEGWRAGKAARQRFSHRAFVCPRT